MNEMLKNNVKIFSFNKLINKIMIKIFHVNIIIHIEDNHYERKIQIKNQLKVDKDENCFNFLIHNAILKFVENISVI
jgi:hypothetical protein